MGKIIIALCLAAMAAVFFMPWDGLTGAVTGTEDRPLVVWYVVAKWIKPDFLDMVERYQPDIILLTVYAEDDIVPMNRANINLSRLVEDVHERGSRIYFSFSLFSRSAVTRDAYEKMLDAGIPYAEQDIHMCDYSRHLRENDPDLYHYWFDYFLERGVDPEKIPHVERKPVEGFYIPPGQYTSIDPLYKPYRDYMVRVIEDTITEARPDGLAFDHGRFFTFDDGYNQDIRDWILDSRGLDIYNYTPAPFFQIDARNWTEDDRTYYDARAEVVSYAVSDITDRFPGFEIFGTTIGMIESARSNGQYVELQTRSYDSLLLMEYGEDGEYVRWNVNATKEACRCPVILGIYPFEDPETAIQNIDIGVEAGARGIYLLGYEFPDVVHEHLLEIRHMNDSNLKIPANPNY